jgi:hypothetical protein
MPDYFIQFSCLLDVGTAENASAAETIRGELAAELDRHEGVSLGFDMDVHHESGPGALWIRSDEYGEPEHVIRFVLRCAERLNLEGVWGFTWSHSCSKPRLDAFGGGAHVIDLGTRSTIDDIDCSSFLAERIPSTGAVFAAKPAR